MYPMYNGYGLRETIKLPFIDNNIKWTHEKEPKHDKNQWYKTKYTFLKWSHVLKILIMLIFILKKIKYLNIKT